MLVTVSGIRDISRNKTDTSLHWQSLCSSDRDDKISQICGISDGDNEEKAMQRSVTGIRSGCGGLSVAVT